jgi:ATP-dependent exoDNAse (exonuclease V) beta subunit
MLQAPAGSGKTELLMQRFLACLATVEQPESVLAITFTRKAAAEMRNRILRALQDAKQLSPAEISQRAPHEQQSLQLARAVLNASAALGWNILDNPARLQVRTLDSFCEAVAQRAPFKDLLGGVAQVTEDAQPLYELAAQRVIDQLAAPGTLGAAIATLLRYVDNKVEQVRDLLAAMLARRDQWLHFLGRSDVFGAAQQEALRGRLEAALTLSVEEDLAAIREVVGKVLSEEHVPTLVSLMRYAAGQLAISETPGGAVIESMAASAEVVSISSGAVHPLRNSAAWPAARAENLPAWRAICDFLLTADRGKPALRKTVDKRSGFPAGTVNGDVYRERCIRLLKELAAQSGAEQLCEALSRTRRLPDPRYTEAQWQFMRALLEVLPQAAANLKVVFSEQAVVDFAEYAQRAQDAIGQEGDPTELGLQLGYRIRHILVDEFQDTNRMQVELLARLLSTWEAGELCSTFCVGDPMQSIYAFREADVAIFQEARAERKIGGHQHEVGGLSRNFRSQANLVEWFNKTFPAILCEESDLTNAVKYTEAEASRPALDGAAVAIKGFAKGDRVGEAKHLAECIRRELKLPAPGNEKLSIAILVRSRTHLPELVEALREKGIKYRAVKTDRLADRPLVRDLEALRTALTDRADRTAWLAILRAPWCGLALADLLDLCRGDEHSTVCELLRQRGARLSGQARTALARCLPVLEDALARWGRAPLRALVESTWLRLGGPASLGDREQGIRDAETYFALLDAQSSAGILRDPENFAAKLHELFAPADPSGDIRVEIMPIHQAKGLEWDVVFLPALERHARQDDKSLLYWRPRRRGELEFLLLGPMEEPGKKNGKPATIEGYLRNIAADCAREELKRLFYVAATRARQRLYLSAVVPENRQPDANSMLRLLWDAPGMRQEFAPPEVTANVAADAPGPEFLLRQLPATFVAPAAPEPLQWSTPERKVAEEEHSFDWAGEVARHVGVVAHAFLECIATEGLSRWDAGRVVAARPAIAVSLLRSGVEHGKLEQAVVLVSEALSRTLADDRGRWLLSPHLEHRCELAVTAVVEGRLEHVRVDRTFVESGTRWLIDYKTSPQEGGDPLRFARMQVWKYRPDMQRYVRVLRAFDPRPVRCALYLPLLGQFCEVEIEVAYGEGRVAES